jgi:hypothetical protein
MTMSGSIKQTLSVFIEFLFLLASLSRRCCELACNLITYPLLFPYFQLPVLIWSLFHVSFSRLVDPGRHMFRAGCYGVHASLAGECSSRKNLNTVIKVIPYAFTGPHVVQEAAYDS